MRLQKHFVMNLLGTFQPRLVAIPSVVLLSNGPELALHRHNIENKKKHAYISYPAVQEQ
jgi:hypothetical protein